MNALHKRWIEDNFEIAPSEVYEEANDFTPKIHEDIKFRMLNQKNYAFDMYSFYGRGKSTIAQHFGNYTHQFILSPKCRHLVDKIEEKYGRKPAFDITNICFDTTELLKRISESVPMETFIYDEARSEKVTGSGSMREKWDKERILKRVRVLQHNFILCDPLGDESKMGKLCLYKIKPVGIDYEKKLNRSLLFALNEGNDTYEMVGHIITKQFEVKGYLEKKLGQARAVELQEFGGDRSKLYKSIAEKILKEGVEGVTSVKTPITDYKFQDWGSLLEVATNFQYAKDEIKLINQFLRALTARAKEAKKPTEKK